MPKTGSKDSVRIELQEVSLLFEISQVLDRSLDLREVAGPVLKSIAKHRDMVRGNWGG